jgi:hypothetical protein
VEAPNIIPHHKSIKPLGHPVKPVSLLEQPCRSPDGPTSVSENMKLARLKRMPPTSRHRHTFTLSPPCMTDQLQCRMTVEVCFVNLCVADWLYHR